jgi:hypothetical protein
MSSTYWIDDLPPELKPYFGVIREVMKGKIIISWRAALHLSDTMGKVEENMTDEDSIKNLDRIRYNLIRTAVENEENGRKRKSFSTDRKGAGEIKKGHDSPNISQPGGETLAREGDTERA